MTPVIFEQGKSWTNKGEKQEETGINYVMSFTSLDFCLCKYIVNEPNNIEPSTTAHNA